MPLVPALASVWQEPHFDTNAFLPAIRLALSAALHRAAGRDERQRGQHAARPREATPHRTPPVGRSRMWSCCGSSSEGGTLSEGAVAPRGPRAPRAAFRAAAGPRARPARRRSRPSPRRSQDQRSRTVRTRPSRVRRAARARPQPPDEARGERPHGVVVHGEREPSAACAGTASASAAATSARPEWPRHDRAARRMRPPPRRPFRTPPGRCSARPAPRRPAAARPAPRAPAALSARRSPPASAPPRDSSRARLPPETSRNASRCLRGSGGAPSSSSERPARATWRAPRRSPEDSAASSLSQIHRDRRRSRPPRAGHAAPRADTSGQHASSRSTPLLTISLPTKATSRSLLGIQAADRHRPPRGRRDRRRWHRPSRPPRRSPPPISAGHERSQAIRRRTRLAGLEIVRLPLRAAPASCAR